MSSFTIERVNDGPTEKTFRIHTSTTDLTADVHLTDVDRHAVDSHNFEMPHLPDDATVFSLRTSDPGILRQLMWMESEKCLKVPAQGDRPVKSYTGPSLAACVLEAYRDNAFL